MPDFAVPANDATYCIDADGKLTEVVVWNVDIAGPNLTLAPVPAQAGFVTVSILLPDGQRYSYPGWDYEGFGPSG